MKTFILMSLSVIIASSCTSKKPEKKPIIYPNNSPEVSTVNPKQTSITAKQVASAQGTNLVTELKFPKGKSEVSQKDQKRIEGLFERAKENGKISQVQLITWADKEFPSKSKKDLGENQKKIVDERNNSLEEVLNKLDDGLEIKKISMAERASALARFTGNQEAEVKKSLDFNDTENKTSESMVIFILEKED